MARMWIMAIGSMIGTGFRGLLAEATHSRPAATGDPYISAMDCRAEKRARRQERQERLCTASAGAWGDASVMISALEAMEEAER